MFPNPHDALPLPARPHLDQYKKLAKELARAEGAAGIRSFVEQWLSNLQTHVEPASRTLLDSAKSVAGFATEMLLESAGSTGSLAKAQFILARCHGFESWSIFRENLDRVTHASSKEARFEAAADAVVNGNETLLADLLKEDSSLTGARSVRQHQATLLHYVSANGVENYRQKSPLNAVWIAEFLLSGGAEVDAEANLYGGHATTLVLVATSAPPHRAGVQIPLMDVLLRHGAKSDNSLVHACLGNNQPAAAEFLISRGAALDVASASALGRLAELRQLLPETRHDLTQAFLWACSYGQLKAAEFLLEHGVNIDVQDRQGQTGLHHAAMRPNLQIARLLITHGASLDVNNCYGGTPLGQALWSASEAKNPEIYLPVITLLLNAGGVAPDFYPSVFLRRN